MEILNILETKAYELTDEEKVPVRDVTLPCSLTLLAHTPRLLVDLLISIQFNWALSLALLHDMWVFTQNQDQDTRNSPLTLVDLLFFT